MDWPVDWYTFELPVDQLTDRRQTDVVSDPLIIDWLVDWQFNWLIN